MNSNISEDELSNAIAAHAMWKMKLNRAISDERTEISSKDVCRDDLCIFGKWLNSSAISDADRAGMPFKVTSRIHSEFHQVAGSVLGHVERGEVASAQEIMDGKYAETSGKLVRALRKWRAEL